MKSVMNWAGYEKKAFFSSLMRAAEPMILKPAPGPGPHNWPVGTGSNFWLQETVCLSVCPFHSCLGGVLEVSRESLRVLKIKGVLKGVLE